jgi:hypothetical protein
LYADGSLQELSAAWQSQREMLDEEQSVWHEMQDELEVAAAKRRVLESQLQAANADLLRLDGMLSMRGGLGASPLHCVLMIDS